MNSVIVLVILFQESELYKSFHQSKINTGGNIQSGLINDFVDFFQSTEESQQ